MSDLLDILEQQTDPLHDLKALARDASSTVRSCTACHREARNEVLACGQGGPTLMHLRTGHCMGQYLRTNQLRFAARHADDAGFVAAVQRARAAQVWPGAVFADLNGVTR